MTTITITNIADLRAGDVATCTQEGHEFTGEVWAGAYGELFVPDAALLADILGLELGVA